MSKNGNFNAELQKQLEADLKTSVNSLTELRKRDENLHKTIAQVEGAVIYLQQKLAVLKSESVKEEKPKEKVK